MSILNFMPHQQQALDQTESFNRCAYYLDMGLGKTFVGAEKMYLLNNDVNLVVCQKSKIDDWVDHFEKYYPDYEVFNLTKKTQAVRFRELIDTSTIYDYKKQIVGVINYDLMYRRSYITHLFSIRLVQWVETSKKQIRSFTIPCHLVKDPAIYGNSQRNVFTA